MTDYLTIKCPKWHLLCVVAYLLSGLLICGRCAAQNGTLAEPFPAPAPNAALHYQRAMLHLSKLDDDQLRSLSKPIWEVLPDPAEKQLPREVSSLLRRGRFATQSAATGSRTAACNFGIDFSGAAALRVRATSGDLLVGSRTYNDQPGGTHGQSIAGVPEDEALEGFDTEDDDADIEGADESFEEHA